jgi:hypothetical protein
VDKGFYSNNLQWDGEYLALQAGFSNEIYRVAVSRSSGTVVQTISLCDLGRIGMVKSRCNGFRGAVALSGVGFREAYAPLRATRQGNAGRRSY